MSKKKFIISIIIVLLAIVLDILMGLILHNHLMEVTVEELFIKFTLVPMVMALIVPFFATLICTERKIAILSYIFAVFLYLHNYIVIDSYFKPEVIAQVMKNSNVIQEGVSISSSTDVSSMITTVITIFALTSIGIFFGKKLNSVLLRLGRGVK